jgi:hypothetical protein
VTAFFLAFFVVLNGRNRFATELSGRKARRRNWEGLAEEMMRAGWFDNY